MQQNTELVTLLEDHAANRKAVLLVGQKQFETG
jgi:hypothetical protein